MATLWAKTTNRVLWSRKYVLRDSRLLPTLPSSLVRLSHSSNPSYGSHSSWPRQELIPTSGTYPKGWKAGGLATGVKKGNAKDLSLIVSPSHPVTAAAVFTTNSFAAAPVQVSRKVVTTRPDSINALIVNSGCANACTGEQGMKDAWEMSKAVDRIIGKESNEATVPGTVVMSTGVIGQHLQMDKIVSGIQSLAHKVDESHEAWMGAAEGIMTTDTFPKLRSREFTTSIGATYRMAGWSKGAGMIHPNMATMLSSVFTDIPITPSLLRSATQYAAARSFNAISIDGDTSTNDTFAVLSNCASTSIPLIDSSSSPEYIAFRENLTEFATDLAKLIVRDGEGATKFVSVMVAGTKSFEDAKKIASTVCTSPLVKTALYGKDANWGRIVCAVGYSGVEVDPSKINLYVSGGGETIHLFKNGAPFDVDEEKAARILENGDLDVKVEVGLGAEEATMFTCDFSHGYISINADYRS